MASDLNPSQHAAVEHDLGPLLVLAGAGSGKTRVVTQRVARLIDRGVSAKSILAMTFTNKAAAEMHARVVAIVGKKIGKDLEVSTFHHFGLGVLGKETKALGLRGKAFSIFDQADASGVVREILREVSSGKNYDIGAILARISNAKNAFISPEDLATAELAGKGVDEYEEITSVVYPRYLAALRSFQAFDFDDLICEVVLLFRRRAEVLERWRERFRYLIVDEYQDTNHAQLELVRLLGGEHRNVCVVGDDDQSIYAWRGADVRNILDFEQHFPGAKIVKLEENYRSSKAILDVAGTILTNAGARRHPKTIVATREPGEQVDVVIAADPEVEAAFVGAEIQRLLDRGTHRPKDFAVLYRSNLQSTDIEAALKERQIPIRMIGGQQFYERKEVKDLVAYLRLALKPDDEMSLRRVVNYPARGLGDVALAKIAAHATAYDMSMWAVVMKPHVVQDLAPAAIEGCRSLVRIIEATRARFDRGALSTEVARGLVDDVGLKADIQAGSSNNVAARRWGNVESILGVFSRRDDKGKGDRASFSDFLRILSLREESEEDSATDRVTLTTMHGAKGLEFRVVFVVGLEEGLMPHSRTLNERATDVPAATGEPGGATSLEEERRLFYVAVTRARDKLYLMRAKVRGMRGKVVQRVPSRFLLEVPEELVVTREEMAAAKPEATETKAGASGLLAALFEPTAQTEAPLIVRRRP